VNSLLGKKIILGLTGGIAIYKSAYLLRRLCSDYGADVQVVMTKSALEFMSPVIFETFSGKKVISEMFPKELSGTRHVDLPVEADMVLVAPATANILAKAAHGISDDLLSAIILVAGNKTVFAPAMNVNMLENPATIENIRILKERSYDFIDSEEGELACNTSGKGRLADEYKILEIVESKLAGNKLLDGKNVIVTAGPTREYIDPVRFISNRSSGKMGYAVAAEAVKQGARVTLISGPTNLATPFGVEKISIESANDLQKTLLDNNDNVDYLFMVAAVEDLCPLEFSKDKIKKNNIPEKIDLKLAPDIVSAFRKLNPQTCIIGFSVEMENGKRRSIEKMKSKNLDYIVWNDPSKKGVAFETETNEVTVFSAKGMETFLKKDTKRNIAQGIIKLIKNN